jgi:hypothetical protein
VSKKKQIGFELSLRINLKSIHSFVFWLERRNFASISQKM